MALGVKLRAADERIDGLANQRRGIDGSQTPVPAVVAWYSQTVRELMRISTEVIKVVDDGRTT